MEFVIAAPERAYLPVQGSSAVFPVHRIYCVGRNYAAHTVEMGGDPTGDARRRDARHGRGRGRVELQGDLRRRGGR